MIRFFKSLYLSSHFFMAVYGIALIFLFSYWFEILYPLAWILSLLFLIIFLADIVVLFGNTSVKAERKLPEKFSNSDENAVEVLVQNQSNITLKCEVIDELPVQFQKRDFSRKFDLPRKESFQFTYLVRPVSRGEYTFGKLNIYTSSFIGLARKRSVFNSEQMVKVYPSFIQMKKLDFLAIDKRISQSGLKRIRRIGHTMEFEQIKEYVPGDDVRTINWKATAKHAELMVNQYQDERAQPVYSVIDTGRVMKMPFKGLSLLDYSINSALAFSNVALKKKDKAGLLTFSSKIEFLLKASSRLVQLNRILENLYNIDTRFLDSDFGQLYAHIKKDLSHRSLLLLYTNFEHISALQRQLPYLKAIAKKHVLVVIFFENTELEKLVKTRPESVRQSAHQTVAEQFAYEKELMAKELQKHGIQALLTKPEDLSVNTINKYLEIKARGLI
ncbi:MAG: DUF58 domain-containing protein [Salegentibacter sp.]